MLQNSEAIAAVFARRTFSHSLDPKPSYGHATLTFHLAHIRPSLIRIAKKTSAVRPVLAGLPFFLHYSHPTTWRKPHDRLQCSAIPGKARARQGIPRCPQEGCHRLAGSP